MRSAAGATLVLALIVAGCTRAPDDAPAVTGHGGGTAGRGGGGGAGGGSVDGGTVSSVHVQLRYDGALTYIARQRIEISAPILPRTSVIYQPFPATLEGEVTMAHDASLTFDWLLQQCAAIDSAIQIEQPGGPPLSAEQLALNYNLVAECAYTQYTAKPYWIPKLVGDVDICGTELGEGWRLITEEDLQALGEPEYAALQETLTAARGGFGGFYFGLAVWVRAADGSIAAGTLEPAVAPRVTPLVFTNGFTEREHYEGGLSLRCIRRTDPPDTR